MLSTKALLIRVVAGIALTLAGLGAALYCFVFVYAFKVTNQSGQTLTDVQLIVPGRTRQIGAMPQGDSRWVMAIPTREERLALSFKAGGQTRREEDRDGYMSVFSGAKIIVVTIQPSLRVKFEY